MVFELKTFEQPFESDLVCLFDLFLFKKKKKNNDGAIIMAMVTVSRRTVFSRRLGKVFLDALPWFNPEWFFRGQP